MNYWANKDSLKSRAINHTTEVAQTHREDIRRSVESTIEYADGCVLPAPCDKSEDMQIIFEATDSVSAIKMYSNLYGGRICVLNFADYMHPGGKFLEGSSAQEESLCHASVLFNILKSERIRGMFYDAHRGKANRCCYSDHLLYVPEVWFEGDIMCDVIVCAAPNKGAAMNYHSVNALTADMYMQERCNAVLQAAAYHRVDTLILGAFGCGVFRNDPRVVSERFKALLDGRYQGSFKRVIFAVPGDGSNSECFKKICNIGG